MGLKRWKTGWSFLISEPIGVMCEKQVRFFWFSKSILSLVELIFRFTFTQPHHSTTFHQPFNMHIVFQSKTEMNAMTLATRSFVGSISLIPLFQVALYFIPLVYYQHHEMNGYALLFVMLASTLSIISGISGLYSVIRNTHSGARIASTGWLLTIILQLAQFMFVADFSKENLFSFSSLVLTEVINFMLIEFYLLLEQPIISESELSQPLLLADELEHLQGTEKLHIQLIN